MNEIQNIDLIFEQNFSSIYEEIFLFTNEHDTIFEQLSEKFIDFNVSITVVAQYNALLRSYLEIPLSPPDISIETFCQALEVISSSSKGALHNFMVFLQDVKELDFQQLIHLDLMLLRSYNLDFCILQKTFSSINHLNQTFLIVATPVGFSAGFQIYKYSNLFFVERTTEPAAHSQYLLNVQLADAKITTGTYDWYFNVCAAYPLPNTALPLEIDQNYSPFGMILAKLDEQKYSELIIASNSRLLTLKVSTSYGLFLDDLAGNRVKLLIQNGKAHAALPVVFQATLVDNKEIQNIRRPSNPRINDVDIDSTQLTSLEAVRYCDVLEDSQFSGFMLSAKIEDPENDLCPVISSSEGVDGYYYLYMANSRLFAAPAGVLCDINKGTRISFHAGEFHFTFYDETADSATFEMPMDYFVEAYAAYMNELVHDDASVSAIEDGSVFECTIQEVFQYSYSNYWRIVSLIIHNEESQERELQFVPPTWDQTPDLVFEEANAPLFTPLGRSVQLSFTPNSNYSEPCFATEASEGHGFSLQASSQNMYQMSPPREPRAKIEVSLISSVADEELSQFQSTGATDVNLREFMITGVNGYVRYHFPSYNIAIVAFQDPYQRDDEWTHSLAIWRLPLELERKVARHAQLVLTQGKEDLYFARANVICDVYPLDQSSGIYEIDTAEFVDYVDPSTECSNEHLVEGSVYWQEIDKEKKQDNTFGFVRLASGHERHFFCKRKAALLGHLVQISLQENKQHPNSCELLHSLQEPPDKQRWLYGRVIDVFQSIPSELENVLKKSFRTTLTHPGPGKELVNGIIMAEPFEGTHVDICFFRLVEPDFVIQQLKPGAAVYFTLKDEALHKVIDEAKYEIPVEMLNDFVEEKVAKKHYKIQSKEQGNSAKLSCWAVDNISISTEIYQGDFTIFSEKNCEGIKPESIFFSRYKEIIQQTRDSIIYVPRPVIESNVEEQLIKDGERFRFNVYFTFNDQKSAFLPEASHICRIEQEVMSEKIIGRIHKIKFEREFLYIFKPEQCDNASDNLEECIGDQIIPLTDCFLVKSSCFYLLESDIINFLYKSEQHDRIRGIFNSLVSGEVPVLLKTVSLGLVNTNYFDDEERFRELEWCRYADELSIRPDTLEILKIDDEGMYQFGQDDFLKY